MIQVEQRRVNGGARVGILVGRADFSYERGRRRDQFPTRQTVIRSLPCEFFSFSSAAI